MTKRIVGSSCAAIFALTAVVAGQAPASSPPHAPVQGGIESPAVTETRGEPSPTERQVTLVGCVAQAGDRSLGTNQFVLLNASRAPNPGGAAAEAAADARQAGTRGATGTSGASPSSAGNSASGSASNPAPVGTSGIRDATVTSYGLTGLRESDLAPYVGQRVEVVGRVVRRAAASTPASPTAVTAPSSSESSAASPRSGSVPSASPGAGDDRDADNDRDADDDRDDAAKRGRQAGTSRPGSPVSGAPGSTAAAPGGPARDAPGGPGDGASSQRASSSQPMPDVTIMSVRPVGGSCQ